MQKTKKQLLGFAGLAAVGIMTAVAYAMPAAAAEDVPPSADGDVNISVTILRGKAMVQLTNPADKSVITANGDITYSYEETSKVKVTVERATKDGYEVVFEKDYNYDPTTYGTGSVPLNDIPGFGDQDASYKVTVKSYDAQGQFANEDAVTFSYRGVVSTPSEKPASNGDPQVDVTVNDDVEKVVIQVYDKNGNPVFVDKDGKETPIIIDRNDIDENGNILVQLPFEDYGVPSGDYDVVIVGYDKNGNIVSTDYVQMDGYVHKDPNLPETPPNTGLMIGGLNISRVDYLITGLIVFGTVAGFALYLVYRKSRR